MYIVSHIGGTCGDLIAAVIDSTDVSFRSTYAVKLPLSRLSLKRGILNTDEEINQYLLEIFKKYKSVSSHLPLSDVVFYDNIKIITPVVYDKDIALWAANRFTSANLVKPYNHINGSVCENDEEYANILLDHTKYMVGINPNSSAIFIDVKDIVEGNLINKLQDHIDTELDSNFYQQWLTYDINRYTVSKGECYES